MPRYAPVLPSPRTPEWGCACGDEHNWRSRTACKTCGKAAPYRIQNDAKRAADSYWWKKPAAHAKKEPSQNKSQTDRIRELERQLSKLQTMLPNTSQEDNCDMDSGESGAN